MDEFDRLTADAVAALQWRQAARARGATAVRWSLLLMATACVVIPLLPA